MVNAAVVEYKHTHKTGAPLWVRLARPRSYLDGVAIKAKPSTSMAFYYSWPCLNKIKGGVPAKHTLVVNPRSVRGTSTGPL